MQRNHDYSSVVQAGRGLQLGTPEDWVKASPTLPPLVCLDPRTGPLGDSRVEYSSIDNAHARFYAGVIWPEPARRKTYGEIQTSTCKTARRKTYRQITLAKRSAEKSGNMFLNTYF